MKKLEKSPVPTAKEANQHAKFRLPLREKEVYEETLSELGSVIVSKADRGEKEAGVSVCALTAKSIKKLTSVLKKLGYNVTIDSFSDGSPATVNVNWHSVA